MKLRQVYDPPWGEVLALFAERVLMPARLKRLHAAAAVLQVARSEVVGYYAGSELIAAACYYPLAPEGEIECRELAFACKPCLKFYLRDFVRLAQLTRHQLAKNGGVRIVARVRVGHRPGQRLAALCGLSRAQAGANYEIWQFETRGQPR